MSCEHDCTVPPVFPKPIANRPGLARIDYRIGTYAELRAHLLDALDKTPELAAWTHRGTDDPGIALLESAAVVGDILTYYQSLYANEAYLRTAQWRTSIMDLVRLLGYRLAPGVGGEAVFALALKERAEPVVVPSGFGLKAQVGADTKPSEFETSESLTAYAHLSKFRLYRPRKGAQTIASGANALELKSVGGATASESAKTDLADIQALKLKSGDRVLLMPAAISGKTEIMVVDKVETQLDRRIVTFKGNFTTSHGTQVTAYKLKRSFRHFGNNAPAFLTTVSGTSVFQSPTDFTRRVFTGSAHDAAWVDSDHYSTLATTDMPLDQKVNDLVPGGKLVCQGFVEPSQEVDVEEIF